MSEGPNLFKRKGVYYTRVQIDGRDQRRSLRTSSIVEARKRAKKILAEVEEFRVTGTERHAWKTAVIEWAGAMVGSVKESVLKRYKISLRQLRPQLDHLYIEDINTKTIAEIVKARRKEGATNATIKRDLTAVSSVLRYCCAQGWREDNPAKAYDRSVIREKRDPIVLPDPADIDAVVALAPGNFARLIRFAQYTGMRQEEVASLERGQVRGRVVDLWKTKTSRPRAVPLDERAAGTLAGTVAHIRAPWVFWHEEDVDGERQGTRYRNVKGQFAEIVRRAVRDKKVKNRFIFHHLRHWYAVDYLRTGGNIYDLQKILGHSSIRTTELYLEYLTPDEQRAAKLEGPAQTRHTNTGSQEKTGG
jgi:integrase/recombinase XerD